MKFSYLLIASHALFLVALQTASAESDPSFEEMKRTAREVANAADKANRNSKRFRNGGEDSARFLPKNGNQNPNTPEKKLLNAPLNDLEETRSAKEAAARGDSINKIIAEEFKQLEAPEDRGENSPNYQTMDGEQAESEPIPYPDVGAEGENEKVEVNGDIEVDGEATTPNAGGTGLPKGTEGPKSAPVSGPDVIYQGAPTGGLGPGSTNRN